MNNLKEKNKFQIDDASEGMRLDNYLLKTIRDVPKSKIYSIIRKGEVRVNSKRVKPLYKLKIDDLVRIPPNLIKNRSQKKKSSIKYKDLDWIDDIIIHEDKAFLVLNKPSGIAVHGGSGVSSGLIELLRAHRDNNKEDLELVHRLDKETSGCLLISRKRSKLRLLHKYFRDGRVEKTYLGLLMGSFKKKSFLVDQPLKINRDNNQRKAIPDKHGKRAITEFNLVEEFTNCALFQIKPITGKTHQIRAHANFIGKPLAGDQRYNPKPDCLENVGLKRLFLHAASISFPLPNDSEKKITIESNLGNELINVIAKLRI